MHLNTNYDTFRITFLLSYQNLDKIADTHFYNNHLSALFNRRTDIIKSMDKCDPNSDQRDWNPGEIKRHQNNRFDIAGKWEDSSGKNNRISSHVDFARWDGN